MAIEGVVTAVLPAAKVAAPAVSAVTPAVEAAGAAAKIAGAVEQTGAVAAELKSIPTATEALATDLEKVIATPHEALENLAKETPTVAESSSHTPLDTPGKAEGLKPPLNSGESPKDTPSLDASEPIREKQALAEIEKVTQEAHEEIEAQVNTKIQEWDQQNPEPNRDTEPEKYNQWIKDRAEVQSNARVDGSVNAALKNWEESNPMPDKDKEPEKYNKWVEERAQKEKDLRQAKNLEEQNNNKDKKGEKKEESEEEVAAKIKRLKELYVLKADLLQAIATLENRSVKSDEDKLQLTNYRLKKDSTNQEIKVIEQQLAGAISRAPLPKKMLIIAALAALPVVAMGMQAAKST